MCLSYAAWGFPIISTGSTEHRWSLSAADAACGACLALLADDVERRWKCTNNYGARHWAHRAWTIFVHGVVLLTSQYKTFFTNMAHRSECTTDSGARRWTHSARHLCAAPVSRRGTTCLPGGLEALSKFLYKHYNQSETREFNRCNSIVGPIHVNCVFTPKMILWLLAAFLWKFFSGP